MLLSFILIYFPDSAQKMIYYIFQERDISRAQELLNGSFIFFGPELTGGGNLPGPFYYFLLTPPLLLGFGWMGAWYWMLILLSLGGALGWYYFRTKFGLLAAFLWLMLFLLAKTTTGIIKFFVNPSFSIFFIVLINISILRAFTETCVQKRGRAFIGACFFVGLAIQLHYSNIPYIFALITLQLFAKKLKIFSIELKKFYWGLGAFALTLAPYLLWLALKNFGITFGQALPFGGETTNSVPSLLAHFKTFFEATTAAEFITQSLKKIFIVTPLIFLIILFLKLIFHKKSNKIAEKNFSTIEHDAIAKVLGICLLFVFIPFSFYFLVPQGSRYGAPFAITLGFLTAVLCSNFIKAQSKSNYYAFAGFFIAGCITILQIPLQNNLYRSIHAETNMPVNRQWKRIWNKIYSDTGWSYEEAIKRIYFINHQREQSPKSAYNNLIQPSIDTKPFLSRLPDGYFVSIDKSITKKTIDWLIEQPIQDEIRDGLLSGDIIIGRHNPTSPILIAPFFVINKKILPAYFHNAGWGYDKLPEEYLFNDFASSSGVKTLAANQYLFKWNECPEKHRYCDTGAIVTVVSFKDNIYKFDIKIVGLPLSQSSRWISPAWTQAWIEPYFEVYCAKKRTKFRIASSIGYNPKYLRFDPGFKYAMTNNSILAPFIRNFEVHCTAALSEISVGRESSIVDRVPNMLSLPQQKLSIQL